MCKLREKKNLDQEKFSLMWRALFEEDPLAGQVRYTGQSLVLPKSYYKSQNRRE